MKTVHKGKVEIIDAGLIPYKEAWDLQTVLHRQLIDNKREGYPTPQRHYFILCEHPPVFTLGKSGSEDNLRINEEERADKQFEYFKINRGGDITYHGPGQLVGYPILDLDLLFTDVHKYVRSLEEVIIRTLHHYGIQGVRSDRYTGVWVDNDQAVHEASKICAIGVHLSRWVTMHGFAFNVNTNLAHFDYIIPCGINDPDKSVCSLGSLLGKTLDLQEVKNQVRAEFGVVFDLETTSTPLESLLPFTLQNL
ncbi:MAG TPA: lipoyl(octanoyl) transferase LipB [Saprospiraceae bacterium]